MTGLGCKNENKRCFISGGLANGGSPAGAFPPAPHLPSLRTLALPGNGGLGDAGAAALAPAALVLQARLLEDEVSDR